MQAVVELFWILFTLVTALLLVIALIFAASSISREAQKERAKEVMRRQEVQIPQHDDDSLTRRDLRRSSARLMRQDRKRPRGRNTRPGNWHVA